ncbi:DUF4262 domain-containing protein (plasmid) [Halopseudomonas sp. SMJS2]|uniref:DUF4262 domain-containing protein n=1 Tax=Halopseudomonas sp. SMJS2 TaxID=3041098 RepID=UPI0024534F4C|nr:DUF4262 domain-containing protein [Halopseudomonas sp. SMJS2]WGK63479.1 DUF4262 domain-containing protein [Halopseudomonas sp. SMJS2]
MQQYKPDAMLGAEIMLKGEGSTWHGEMMGRTSLLAQIDDEIELGRVKLYRKMVFIASRQTYCTQSVGMFRFGLPEIVLFGIDSDSVVSQVLDHLIAESIGGRKVVVEGVLPVGYFSRNAYGFEVQPHCTENYCDLIYTYYQLRGLECPRIVQWVFADNEGRFPWNPAADPAVTSIQALLMNNVS